MILLLLVQLLWSCNCMFSSKHFWRKSTYGQTSEGHPFQLYTQNRACCRGKPDSLRFYWVKFWAPSRTEILLPLWAAWFSAWLLSFYKFFLYMCLSSCGLCPLLVFSLGSPEKEFVLILCTSHALYPSYFSEFFFRLSSICPGLLYLGTPIWS